MVARYPHRARLHPSAPQEPRRQPRLDLGRKVPDEVARTGVDPHPRILRDRRVREEQQLIARLQIVHIAGPLAKDGAVHRGEEVLRTLRREGRLGSARIHGL